jgi:glucose-6-phosphate 1-dehydrogenase
VLDRPPVAGCYEDKKDMSIKLDFIIFGGTGDLAKSRIFPALYRLFENKYISDLTILSISKDNLVKTKYLSDLKSEIKQKDEYFDGDIWHKFERCITYICLDVEQKNKFEQIKEYLKEESIRIFYCGIQSSLYCHIADGLRENNCINSKSHIVLEKPIGNELQTAKDIYNKIVESFDEDHIYLIDHYLGKETVLNILAFRFGNDIFEELWNSRYINNIQITVAESGGIKNRGLYYDKVGALADMVQNHLLQLLCIIAMNEPTSWDPANLSHEKIEILTKLKLFSKDEVKSKTVRGQYIKGTRDGKEQNTPYINEIGVHKKSDTETFVAIKAEINDKKWNGVPFYLRTGKSLFKQTSKIVIQFKSNLKLFSHQSVSNKLIINLQPEETIELEVMQKRAGLNMVLRPNALILDLAKNRKKSYIEAYDRLILDIIKNEKTLFMPKEEMELSWKWIDAIRDAWKENEMKVKKYYSGTWGPIDADKLLELDQRWHN